MSISAINSNVQAAYGVTGKTPNAGAQSTSQSIKSSSVSNNPTDSVHLSAAAQAHSRADADGDGDGK